MPESTYTNVDLMMPPSNGETLAYMPLLKKCRVKKKIFFYVYLYLINHALLITKQNRISYSSRDFHALHA